MNVKLRQELERKIVSKVIDDALSLGYVISVNDGEETTLHRSSDKKEIMQAMFTTDEDRLYIYSHHGPDHHDNDGRDGWVYFVYGNDGWDVLSDYTVNLESVVKGANDLADSYC